MILTTYFRSTAAYRVRIALNLKALAHELVPVNLLTAEHTEPSFLAHNPEGLLPTLEVEGQVLTQSVAILEYLEEAYPEPPLLPSGNLERAQVRALVNMIASDLHPINNLRVLKYLISDMKVNDEDKMKWYHHWIAKGFSSLEQRLANSPNTGDFCFGNTPTFADICLVPQVYNANRFNCPMDEYPTIQRIDQRCLELDAFAKARPEVQVDAG